MFEADSRRTVRRALVDHAESDQLTFATRTLQWARDNSHETIVWHFHGKSSLDNLRHAWLPSVAGALKHRGEAAIEDVKIVLATARVTEPPGSFKAPLAAWWPGDDRLLAVDSSHRPMLDALVSQTYRAPIWLTAFNVEVGEPIGVRDPDTGLIGTPRIDPIVVSDELQELVGSGSAHMTLSTNGVHDSMAGDLLRDARRLIKSGAATPEAVAVAAIRAGWWPEKVPGLLKKLNGR